MRILLAGRTDLLSHFGGDTQVIKSIHKNLNKLSIKSTIATDYKKIKNYDLIHLFGIMRAQDLYSAFIQAKKNKIPIIVSPINENLSELDNFGRTGFGRFPVKILPNDIKELVKGFFRGLVDKRQLKNAFLQLKTPYSRQQIEILNNSSKVIATSVQEKKDLIKKFKISSDKIEVIPIGIDQNTDIGNSLLFKRKYKLKDFILCVGRIEPKKNQLKIIEALKDIKIPLVFIGSPSKYHKIYVKEFFNKVNNLDYVFYFGQLDRQLLFSAYALAKVHVLASWFETIGIVSLEAAINNCNIVCTRLGYSKEYFGDFAWYCNSNSIISIKQAVIKAFNSPLKKQLKKRIIENLTWDKLVPQMVEVYQQAVSTAYRETLKNNQI